MMDTNEIYNYTTKYLPDHPFWLLRFYICNSGIQRLAAGIFLNEFVLNCGFLYGRYAKALGSPIGRTSAKQSQKLKSFKASIATLALKAGSGFLRTFIFGAKFNCFWGKEPCSIFGESIESIEKKERTMWNF